MTSRRIGGPLPPTVIPLNEVSNAGSLIFLLDFGGNVLYAQPLVQELARDVSCYGIRLAPDMIGQLGEMTISAMAERFANDIIDADLARPIHLIGFSFAGILAFEAARHLSEAGVRPDQLWILDTLIHRKAPGYKMWHNPQQELLYLARYIVLNWRRVLGGDRNSTILHRYGQLRMDLSRHPEAYRVIIRHMYNALASYQPQRWTGSAIVLHAREASWWTRFPDDLGWGKLIDGELQTIAVPGDHLSMLRNPTAARKTADIIRQRLSPPGNGKSYG